MEIATGHLSFHKSGGRDRLKFPFAPVADLIGGLVMDEQGKAERFRKQHLSSYRRCPGQVIDPLRDVQVDLADIAEWPPARQNGADPVSRARCVAGQLIVRPEQVPGLVVAVAPDRLLQRNYI